MDTKQQIEEYMFIHERISSEYTNQIKYLSKLIIDNQSVLPVEQVAEIIQKLIVSNEVLKKLCAKYVKLDDDFKK